MSAAKSTAAPRLFVAPERLQPPEPVRLVGAEHHYLTRVLRLRVGDPVMLLSQQGLDATGIEASIRRRFRAN